jgi:hypothetical protein
VPSNHVCREEKQPRTTKLRLLILPFRIKKKKGKPSIRPEKEIADPVPVRSIGVYKMQRICVTYVLIINLTVILLCHINLILYPVNLTRYRSKLMTM